MRFDWYAATIRQTVLPGEVVAAVADGLGARCVPMGKGMHGYTESVEIRGGGEVLARALLGGQNPYPHVWASGKHTEGLVDVVRGIWPEEHTVSRLDAAEDFRGPDKWDELLGLCMAEAEGRRLAINQAGDWLRDGEAGRTLYLGSKSSPVRVRLYEKGKQLRADGVKHAPLDWVRLELQVRPENQAKWTLAKATPDQAWGCSRWSRSLAEAAMDFDTDKIDGRVWHEADDARALRYLVRQYGPLLLRMKSRLGYWDDVGNTLGGLIDPVVMPA